MKVPDVRVFRLEDLFVFPHTHALTLLSLTTSKAALEPAKSLILWTVW